MNHRIVFRMLGNILRIEAVFLLLPLAVALYTGGGDAKSFLITLLLTAAVGQALASIRTGDERFQARDGFAAVALSWIGMSAFGATLTLPGIAGIVLTVGMAVNANVLIYERIREELRKGFTPLASVKAGFDAASVAIIDSNLTTIITAVILYQFGTGPVRGFAVSLTLGIIGSMFTAVFVSRVIFEYIARKRGSKGLNI